MKEKVILAYSGGLDTTAIIPWLKETYNYDVVCVCADCGQEEELDGLEQRALSCGAAKLYIEDMSLSVVCKYLERWYDVEITLQPGLGEKIRYNGVIQEETVTDVMDALSRLSNISYHVKGKHISITSK